MGLTKTMLTLKNPIKPHLKPIQVNALADTGSTFLFIPEHIKIQLQLEEIEKKEVVLADSREVQVPYVGPVELRFGNRTGFTGALVMGDEPLLGAIPMEDMDLVVAPRSRKVMVNPASPNFATGKVKSANFMVPC